VLGQENPAWREGFWECGEGETATVGGKGEGRLGEEGDRKGSDHAC